MKGPPFKNVEIINAREDILLQISTRARWRGGGLESEEERFLTVER
jgi:hypothetical protein